MIFITGDQHGDIDLGDLNTKNFPQQKNLTKDDYVIVAGDFGVPWDCGKQDRYLKEWYEEKPWTTLVVPGNHENYDALEQIPVEMWNGGKVRKISPSIITLMNGQVYEINGKSFFTMGGATSTDKQYRKPHISWWPQEMPTLEEMQEGVDNMNARDWKVDYIVTHTAPYSVTQLMFNNNPPDRLIRYLDMINEFADYTHWYFGHLHLDTVVKNGKMTALYHYVARL